MRLNDLLAQAPRIREIATAHGATNLAAFGSVARDQAGPDSDLDLLVDLPPRTGLLERIALKLALEDMLRCRVDLIRRRNLKPTALASAERDAIPLCGFCSAVVRPPRGAFLLAMGSSRFSEVATTQAHSSTLRLGGPRQEPSTG